MYIIQGITKRACLLREKSTSSTARQAIARLRMLRYLKEIREMYLLTLVTKQQTRFYLKIVALARLMLDAYDFSLIEE